jgi:hypothetical protein
MRLATLGGAAAFVLAAAIVGCSDQTGNTASGVTAPHGPFQDGAHFRIHGSGSVSIRTANGVIARAIPSWIASGSAREGIVRDESGDSPVGVIAMSAALVRPNAGDRQARFTDADGNQMTAVMYAGRDGAPMRAMRLYRNGVLETGADYEWAAVAGGWSLRSVTRVVMRDGQVTARITTNARGAVEMAARGGVRDALAALGTAGARAITPRELAAQDLLSGPCRKQALDYYAATAALAAAIIAAERTPTPVTLLLVAAAAAKATSAEMAYWLCLQNQDSRNNPVGSGAPTVPIICGSGNAIDPMCGPPDMQ